MVAHGDKVKRQRNWLSDEQKGMAKGAAVYAINAEFPAHVTDASGALKPVLSSSHTELKYYMMSNVGMRANGVSKGNAPAAMGTLRDDAVASAKAVVEIIASDRSLTDKAPAPKGFELIEARLMDEASPQGTEYRKYMNSAALDHDGKELFRALVQKGFNASLDVLKGERLLKDGQQQAR